jgi:glycosyltransferase involved in cell wall biosynthesis
MDVDVFISVCIPAYNRPDYLKRLLDSIQKQTYRHFEVVISDDSAGSEVEDLIRQHPLMASIRYFRNHLPAGTPENWNEAIRLAKGEWIKLMHDDDWFSDNRALQIFAEMVKKHPEARFFFSEYRNVYLENNREEEVRISPFWRKRLIANPENLIWGNMIGPPSVTLHKKIPECTYDKQLKWLVDIDFYIRYLRAFSRPVLVPEMLICVGLGEDQVTRMCFGNPAVEIPENLYLLNKCGVSRLKNIIVYDAFWRFVRNLEIRSLEDIKKTGYSAAVPAIIQSMIKFQSAVPSRLLKAGIFSKSLMFLHYIFQYPKISRG